ncbi:MAG: restriction endonuclease subunit S [Bacteroidales bacterium]|nr:restriction endonuclease subunit S [Bacteroidales bacterium]
MNQYESYKASGIEWLDEIPSHWKEEKLKHIASYNDDVLLEDTPANQSINYVEISDVDSVSGIKGYTTYLFKDAPSRARRCTKKNDIIVSTVRTYLKAIAPVLQDNLIVSTGFAVIRPQKVHPAFLAYSLLNEGFIGEVISKSVGVSYPAINATDLVEIKLPIPPIPEQQAIASYLESKVSQIDSIIAEKEAMVDDLQNYRKSIITETVTRGMNPNASMKDSGVQWIGMIPENWSSCRIKNILDYKNDPIRVGPFGSSLCGNDFVESGYWVYNQRVVLDNNFAENDVFVNETKYKELSGFAVSEGDILVTTRGTIGKIAIVPQGFQPGILHPCIIRFRVDTKRVDKVFLKYIFNDTDLIANQVRYNSNSTTIDVIYSYTLKELHIPLPSLDDQQNIVSYLDSKTQEVDNCLKDLKSQITDLRAYKASLITEAVTGKIDLR